MKIVSVINQKGGVGKTTTAINLSAALSLDGKRTLLIDLDPQAHATAGIGFEPVKATTAELFTQNETLESIIQKTDIPNLDVAPSHIRLATGVEQLYTRMFRERILFDALQDVRDLYEFILIDCPPNLGVLTANALYSSDFVLIPCDMSRYSLESLADLLQTMQNVWRGRDGKKKEEANWRIVLTKYEKRNTVTNEYIEKHLTPYADKVLSTHISKNEALNQAHLASKPIFLYDPKARGAEDYTHLKQELLDLYGRQTKTS